MKRWQTSASLACMSILVACGGGSGGSETTTSTSSNTPTTPTGFPTVLQGAVTGGNTTTPDTTSFQGLTSDIRFDSEFNLRIILTETSGDREVVSFTDEAIDSESQGIRLYQDDQTILLSSTPVGTTLGQNLDYTVFGRWREFDPTGETAFIDGAAFFAGVPTNSESTMPTTGSATYTGVASAQALALDRSFVSALAGQMTANADFTNATLDLDIDFVRPRDQSSWGSVSASGLTISGDRFDGDNVTSSRGHEGSIAGRFFGPSAAEIGGAGDLTNDDSVLQIGFGAAQ